MAFDFGTLLQTLGHNFAQNAQNGATPGGMGQNPMQSRMLQVAQTLKGQPPQAAPQQPGAPQPPQNMQAILQALQRLGGQPPAPIPQPNPAPAGGLPLANPINVGPSPGFSAMFSRYGNGY